MFEPLRPRWELLLVADVCKVTDDTLMTRRTGEYIRILGSSGILEHRMSMVEVMLLLS